MIAHAAFNVFLWKLALWEWFSWRRCLHFFLNNIRNQCYIAVFFFSTKCSNTAWHLFICFYVGHIICITTVQWLNVLWHIASCLSRWFWSPAGERIYFFLQLRAWWERTSRRRWVELTECSREAAGSRVPTGFSSTDMRTLIQPHPACLLVLSLAGAVGGVHSELALLTDF